MTCSTRAMPLLAALAAVGLCAGAAGCSSSPAPADTIAVSLPTEVAGGNVTVIYTISGSGTWDAAFQFSTDGGTTWSGALPASGCPSPRQRSAGSYSYLWDTISDGVGLTGAAEVLVRGSITGSSSTASGTVSNAPVTYLERSATVAGGMTPVVFPAMHRGVYDLSPVVLEYLSDESFESLARQLPAKSWRISVGRWEVGPVEILAPEAACYSLDPSELRSCSREFYRGPNTIPGAQNPQNYDFGYLDSAISAVIAVGAEPYLDFDYMPFVLASNQDPNTADNLYNVSDVLSFSNGIRTSPPLSTSVYAEVVKQVTAHVLETFGTSLTQPLVVEIGNEPDLPVRYFWSGTSAQFLAMYLDCAAALDAAFGSSIRLAAGSFAWFQGETAPTFAQSFLAGLGGARLDILSFHAYGDSPATFFTERLGAIKALRDVYRPSAALHCTEWGMELTEGPKFDDMTAALHHAQALEYFLVFGVTLSHRALIRDPMAAVGQMGLLTAGPPAKSKPAAHAIHAYEMLAETPRALAITASPPDKAMLVAGRDAAGTAITVLFFHEAPVSGTGRMALTIENLPFADYTVDRHVLTDATASNGDGLWLARSRDASGASFSETLTFTDDTLVVLRLTKKP